MTAPLVYALVHLFQDPRVYSKIEARDFEKALKRKCGQPEDVPTAISLLQASAGIELADSLSIEHIRQSIVNLTEIRDPRRTSY